LILSIVVGGALTAAAMLLLRPEPQRAPTPVVRRFSMRIPDDLTVRSSLWVPAFDVSADGNRLAFTAASEGVERRVYIRDSGQLEPRVLGGTDGALTPVLSPDGEWIAFSQDRRVKKMSIRGGPSVTLCDARSGAGLTWADDGHIVFSTNWGLGGTLMRVSENGGQALSIFPDEQGKDNAASQRYVRWPEALPGGDVILYVIESRQTATREIHALVRSTGKRKALLEDASSPRYAASGHLLFVRKGTLMAVPFDPDCVELRGQPIPVVEGVTFHNSGAGQFAIAEDGTLILMLGGSAEGEEGSLVKVGMDGKTEVLSTHRRMFSWPRIAPDGQRVATMIRAEGGSGFDVWILELARGVLSPLTTTGSADTPVWSPDGRWIYFRQREATEAGGPGIWRKRADGSSAAELVLEGSDERLVPCSVSRDGRRLFVGRTGAVVEGGEAHGDIAVIHFEDGGARVEDLVTTPANELLPLVSPDGVWIAYMSYASGRPHVFVQPATGGGARVQVSTSAGYWPGWSPDGEKLYFYQAKKTLMVVDVLKDEAAEPGSAQAAPGQAERMFRVSVPRELFARGASFGFSYDPLPDGEGFLTTSTGETAPGDAQNVANELIVTLNFFEELRRLAPPESSRK
jgi:Tol biopolymer transport system component